MHAPDETILFRWTADNRRRAIALLTDLSAEQWQHPTLCEGWRVHDLAAHLLQPMVTGFGSFLLAALRTRGDTAAAVARITFRMAQRSREEILQGLRDHVDDRLTPPLVGPFGPFADSAIHLRDLARPLGLPDTPPAEHWAALLEHLRSPRPLPSLAPAGRLDGLRFVPTDLDQASAQHAGTALVQGPAEALVMAATGRTVALADLRGEGVALLASRL